MPKRRILVVDDSALVRKMVTLAMEGDPDLESMIAPNGRLALSKMERSLPDLVVLDVEMPDMSGIETLDRIHALHPKLPVVIFSGHTNQGSFSAMEALSHGAVECVMKPSQSKSIEDSLQYVRENLVTKIRLLCHLSEKPLGGWTPVAPPNSVVTASLPTTLPTAPRNSPLVPRPIPIPIVRTTPRSFTGTFDLLVIGVSTGGPNALATLVPHFTKDLGVPVLIVQHMPPMFTKLLADRLATLCPLDCREAVDGEEIAAGDLRLAPGNFHMTVARKENKFVLHLNQDPLENSCRPAVDVLFRHAAACSQNHVLSVILTGMGQDGLRGSESIKAEGGMLIAQDEATSVVWGMPGAVALAGLTDAILPLQEIGPEIIRRLRGMRH